MILTSSLSSKFLNDWVFFLQNHSNANIFQTPELYNVYLETPNYKPFVIFEYREQRLVGVLLGTIQMQGPGIIRTLTARTIIWGGPLVYNNDPAVFKSILNELNKFTKTKSVYIQFRNRWIIESKLNDAFIQEGYIREDHLDIIHDLREDPTILFNRIHPGRKKNIRRAISGNIIFEEITSFSDFQSSLELIYKTYQRVGLPIQNQNFFFAAHNYLSSKCFMKVFAAKFRDKICGIRIVLTYNNEIYDWYSGSNTIISNMYINDFLPWKIIEWGTNHGYIKFDFGGAGKPNENYGVRDFKLKFGGTLVNYGRYLKVNKTLIYYFGKKIFYLYQKFYKRSNAKKNS